MMFIFRSLPLQIQVLPVMHEVAEAQPERNLLPFIFNQYMQRIYIINNCLYEKKLICVHIYITCI